MTNNEMLVKIAAILTTLLEAGSGAPESTFYVAVCNMNMDEWTKLRYVLVESKLVSVKGNYVTLTELGKEKATMLNKLVAKAEAKIAPMPQSVS